MSTYFKKGPPNPFSVSEDKDWIVLEISKDVASLFSVFKLDAMGGRSHTFMVRKRTWFRSGTWALALIKYTGVEVGCWVHLLRTRNR